MNWGFPNSVLLAILWGTAVIAVDGVLRTLDGIDVNGIIMTRIGVTGGTGFVGSALINKLKVDQRPAIKLERISTSDSVPQWHFVSPIDVVIHSAARVHVLRESAADPIHVFRQANVEGTLRLARQAADMGVKRFIFVSSVKVNGELTVDCPFTALDQPAPSDPYGLSKLEAEQGLQALAQQIPMEIVIVRPPLVYGPGVKANFLRLMQLVQLGIPLPLAAVNSRRSMVAIDNLVNLLLTCVDHPRAAGQIFMVSDGRDMSLPELLRMLSEAMHRPSRLFNVPTKLITFGASLMGQSNNIGKLIGSLQVDITHTHERLGWIPVADVRASIEKTVADFYRHH